MTPWTTSLTSTSSTGCRSTGSRSRRSKLADDWASMQLTPARHAELGVVVARAAACKLVARVATTTSASSRLSGTYMAPAACLCLHLCSLHAHTHACRCHRTVIGEERCKRGRCAKVPGRAACHDMTRAVACCCLQACQREHGCMRGQGTRAIMEPARHGTVTCLHACHAARCSQCTTMLCVVCGSSFQSGTHYHSTSVHVALCRHQIRSYQIRQAPCACGRLMRRLRPRPSVSLRWLGLVTRPDQTSASYKPAAALCPMCHSEHGHKRARPPPPHTRAALQQPCFAWW